MATLSVLHEMRVPPALMRRCSQLLRNLLLVQRRNSGFMKGLQMSQQQEMIDRVREGVLREELNHIPTNKAARSYLERVQAHKSFMREKVTEFELAHRHLANIMGQDPATFTRQDADEAIRYLFPSSLKEQARPHMLPPEEVFPQQKEAQFDITGRPYHTLFYTILPNYYQTMHDMSAHMQRLDEYEDSKLRSNTTNVEIIDRLVLEGSLWLSKEEVEAKLLEKLKDWMFEKLVLSLERLCQHPYSYLAKDFINSFRKPIAIEHEVAVVPEVQVEDDGRRYTIAQGTRKTTKALVKLYESGSGLININGSDLLYFEHPQYREQVLLPLMVAEKVGQVDVFCKVEGGGNTGQSCAIRYALAQALTAFCDPDTCEKLRLAGLLTQDVRRHERKKPGQKGARAKYTWRKR